MVIKKRKLIMIVLSVTTKENIYIYIISKEPSILKWHLRRMSTELSV